MSVVHICLDMQVVAGLQFAPELWAQLKHNISRFTSSLAERAVETLFVAHNDLPARDRVWQGFGRLEAIPQATRNLLALHPKLDFDFDLPASTIRAFKNSYSAAGVPMLLDYLKQNNCDTIVLSGQLELMCLFQSALDFRAAGFKVIVAADATERGIEIAGHQFNPRFCSLPVRREDFAAIDVEMEMVGEILNRMDAELPRRRKLYATAASPAVAALR